MSNYDDFCRFMREMHEAGAKITTKTVSLSEYERLKKEAGEFNATHPNSLRLVVIACG